MDKIQEIDQYTKKLIFAWEEILLELQGLKKSGCIDEYDKEYDDFIFRIESELKVLYGN